MEFEPSDKESAKANDFMSVHPCRDKYAGAIGGSFSYVFTPTGIGTAFSVKCNHCGHEENCTAYDEW